MVLPNDIYNYKYHSQYYRTFTALKKFVYGNKSTVKTEDPPETSEPSSSSTEPSISQTSTSAKSSSINDNAVQDFCSTNVNLSLKS
ncbi:hypothetical protein WA026_016664 [Henosepilachna vigintioctopunctata]|uniref:Uncharacterized protein n=1 Tax=Henosepilachna vigintioctopunctata TaxID=420089 RepID=A0AAW1USD7_9CUCU